ncbi:DUF4124 domain-containing protein [Stenotrophomonas bentonitica]|uniref:DUF4124 domain-containing protein n=1 Tax=Stenotrophomonas bentonitica TaxID=1450134 RepID=UPI0037D8EA52
MTLRPALWLALLALVGPVLPAAAQNDNVRIYRCVGSNGAVSLQDARCREGRQQVRDLQRPRDPAPQVVRSDRAPEPTPAPRAPEREVRYVHVQPPQPMYECTTSEGDSYVSDSNEGNPRWVPIWTEAYLPYPPGPRPPSGSHPPSRPLPPIMPMGSGSVRSSGGSLSVSGGGSRVGGSINIGGGSSQWEGGGYPYPGVGNSVVVPAGNVLVRDECHALPAQEVCSRLKDRRWDLIRRYNSALQSERDALTREQRGIDARLDQDCGGH